MPGNNFKQQKNNKDNGFNAFGYVSVFVDFGNINDTLKRTPFLQI